MVSAVCLLRHSEGAVLDRFVQLLVDLCESDSRYTLCEEHVALVVEYLRGASPEDRAWAVYLLWGRRLRRQCSTKTMLDCLEWPSWMIEACVAHTRDELGTCAHLVGKASNSKIALSDLLTRSFDLEPGWVDVGNELTVQATLFYFQFLTGRFVTPVARQSVAEALGDCWNCSSHAVQQALVGEWERESVAVAPTISATGGPWAFCALRPTQLGESAPIGEHRFVMSDGIRVQAVRCEKSVWLWTAAGALLNDVLPTVVSDLEVLPTGTRLDGHVVARAADGWSDRPSLEACIRTHRMNKSHSVEFVGDDVIEYDAVDLRPASCGQRWDQLVELCTLHGLAMASVPKGRVAFVSKRIDGPYAVGGQVVLRPPLIVRAMLQSAKRSETNAGYASFTFAMEKLGELVPIATVDASACDAAALAEVVEAQQAERFGPVRTVKPGLVYRLSIGWAYLSARRKGGYETRSVQVIGSTVDPVGNADELVKALVRVQ